MRVAGGAGLANIAYALPATAQPTVAVVGAGLAGLCAAYELHHAGREVVLLEGSAIPGGRVRTLRGAFDGNAWVDVGAQSAGSGYRHFLGYCRHFGLPLVPEVPVPLLSGERPDTLVVLGDQHLHGSALRAEPQRWPLPLQPKERALAPFRLLHNALQPVVKTMQGPGDVLSPRFTRYDGISLLTFLREQHLSNAAIGLIERTANYNSLKSVSALSAMRDAARLGSPQTSMHIDQGNDRLPHAFAHALDGVIRYECALSGVTREGKRLRLHINTRGHAETLGVDQLIMAIPFTALREIKFSPALPADRRHMISTLPYTQVTKTHVQTATRFWERSAALSAVYTDSRFERIFNMSNAIGEPKGLLLNWINGLGAQAFAGLSENEQSQRVTKWMQTLWPAQHAAFEHAVTTDWGQSYAKGAYAHYAPGQLQAFAPTIARPINGIHFAGEHTELEAPGMEGALVSGLRAAREVIATHGRQQPA